MIHRLLWRDIADPPLVQLARAPNQHNEENKMPDLTRRRWSKKKFPAAVGEANSCSSWRIAQEESARQVWQGIRLKLQKGAQHSAQGQQDSAVGQLWQHKLPGGSTCSYRTQQILWYCNFNVACKTGICYPTLPAMPVLNCNMLLMLFSVRYMYIAGCPMISLVIPCCIQNILINCHLYRIGMAAPWQYSDVWNGPGES